MTIYIVFWDYNGSEEEIHFITSTEEKAKEYVEKSGSNYYSIQPWILDKDFHEQKITII